MYAMHNLGDDPLLWHPIEPKGSRLGVRLDASMLHRIALHHTTTYVVNVRMYVVTVMVWRRCECVASYAFVL